MNQKNKKPQPFFSNYFQRRKNSAVKRGGFVIIKKWWASLPATSPRV